MKLVPSRPASGRAFLAAPGLMVLPPPAAGLPQVAIDFSFLLLPLIGLGALVATLVALAMIAGWLSSLTQFGDQGAPTIAYDGCDGAA